MVAGSSPDVKNIEDLLFDVFKNEDGRVPLGKFVQVGFLRIRSGGVGDRQSLSINLDSVHVLI